MKSIIRKKATRVLALSALAIANTFVMAQTSTSGTSCAVPVTVEGVPYTAKWTCSSGYRCGGTSLAGKTWYGRCENASTSWWSLYWNSGYSTVARVE